MDGRIKSGYKALEEGRKEEKLPLKKCGGDSIEICRSEKREEEGKKDDHCRVARLSAIIGYVFEFLLRPLISTKHNPYWPNVN
jgi:hypothetical protein